jgi:hypothetical protein
MLKALVTVVALAAGVAFTTPSYAQEVVGVIKTYNNGTKTLVLEDGTELLLSEGVTVQEYKPGTKVRYLVESREGKRYATKIIIVE